MNSSTPLAASGTDEIIHHAPAAGFWGLMLGSIGVVYGDIGTSPLYCCCCMLTTTAKAVRWP